MKVPPARIAAFLANPDPSVRAVLVYGADAGLVRERAEALTRAVADDPGDPFRVALMAGSEIVDDPARLADEAAALSFTGGRRVVRVREAGDSLGAIVARFLEAPVGEALVLLEAGALGPRSTLRRAVEGARAGAAVPCYVEAGRELEQLIRQVLADRGLDVDREALAYLTEALGGDRMAVRQELEKLALYMGEGERRRVSLADAAASVGDSAVLSLDDAVLAAADGAHAETDRALDHLFQAGLSPVAVLRAAARHFQRLHLAAGLVDSGVDARGAVMRLRPPVFYRHRERFVGQLGRWRGPAIAVALDRLLDAELRCKSTGTPATALCGRTLMGLANIARHFKNA